MTIPANTLAEFRREHGPTSFFKQSKEIETTRAKRFDPASNGERALQAVRKLSRRESPS
jgi:hypothetical protein